MRKHLVKKVFTLFMVFAMTLVSIVNAPVNKAEAKQADKQDKIQLELTRLPENQTMLVWDLFCFEASVVQEKGKNGLKKNGIIEWEIKEDTAGTVYHDNGIVTPTQTGTFQIRAIFFQSEDKYEAWLHNKVKNDKFIIGSSNWYEIRVEDYVNPWPTITLNGDKVIFHQIGELFIDPGVTAVDSVDGDITHQVVMYGADVDSNYPGEYFLYYEVVNSAGYYGGVERMVVVTDLNTPVAPVIMLPEGVTYYLPLGYEFISYVTAWDYEDGDISDRIVIGGDEIKTDLEGLYHITLNVMDRDGNAAKQKHMTVVVFDPENPKDYFAPVIYLNGPEVYEISVGQDFVDPGVVAWDDTDMDISDRVVVNSNLDINTPGVYEITYDVSDSAGNAATQVRRIVIVEAVNKSEINLIGDKVVFLERGQAYVEPGFTAFNTIEGDITDWVQVNNYLDIYNTGTYYVSYVLPYESGYWMSECRIVVVYEPGASVEPFMVLNGSNTEIVRIGSEYYELGAIAYDDKEGNISERIIIGGDVVNGNQQGIYFITYDVSDSDGNQAFQLIRKVVVMDYDNPIDWREPDITLYDDYYIQINQGEEFVDPGFFAIDDVDGDITDRVIVEGNVDTSTPGLYKITYTVTDNAGNVASRTRYVYVREVILERGSLNGDKIIFLTVGDAFTDPGVTVINSLGEDISELITPEGYIDTNEAGIYYIYYNTYGLTMYDYDLIRCIVVSEEGATIAPVIMLKHEGIYNVKKGYVLHEPGYYAKDDKDGDITANVIVGGDVDYFIEGTYYITYDVTDSDGNQAVQKIRTVIVVDKYEWE